MPAGGPIAAGGDVAFTGRVERRVCLLSPCRRGVTGQRIRTNGDSRQRESERHSADRPAGPAGNAPAAATRSRA
jgi:hypothetical protein